MGNLDNPTETPGGGISRHDAPTPASRLVRPKSRTLAGLAVLVFSHALAISGGYGQTDLALGVPQTGLSGAKGSVTSFRVNVPATSGQRLVVRTWGGTGDAELYGRYGSPVDLNEDIYDREGDGAGLSDNDEEFIYNAPSAGYYYISVDAWKAFSGVGVIAYMEPASTGNLVLNGDPVAFNIDNVSKCGIHHVRLPASGVYGFVVAEGRMADFNFFVRGLEGDWNYHWSINAPLAGATRWNDLTEYDGLAAGDYYLVVQPNPAAGTRSTGSYLAWVIGGSPSQVPDSPKTFTATSDRSDGVKLQWSACARATKYVIYRAPDSDLSQIVKIAEPSSSTLSYLDANAASGMSYMYMVAPKNQTVFGEPILTTGRRSGMAVATVTPQAGPNGMISPNTPQSVDAGGSVEFTATPSPGYAVSGWYVDGKKQTALGNRFTLDNVTKNRSVKVEFANTFLKLTINYAQGLDTKRRGVFGSDEELKINIKVFDGKRNVNAPIVAQCRVQIASHASHGTLLHEAIYDAGPEGKTVGSNFYINVPFSTSGLAPGQYDIRACLEDPSGTPVYEDTQDGENTTAFGESAWVRAFSVEKPADGETNYHALLVGCPEPTVAAEVELVKASLDEMRAGLSDHTANWSVHRIHTLFNQEASVGKVREKVSEIGGMMDADDLFLLFFEGHGSTSALTLAHLDRLSPDELESLFADSLPGQAKKVLLVNACHSGMIVDAFKKSAVSNVFVLTSCRADQDAPMEGRGWPWTKRKSQFSIILRYALEGSADKDGNGHITAGELFDYVAAEYEGWSSFFIAIDWHSVILGNANPQRYPDPPLHSELIFASKRGESTAVPFIELVEPSSEPSRTVTAGEVVPVCWSDRDSDDDASISLAYDLDLVKAPWANESGHQWIAINLHEDDNGTEGYFSWNTSNVVPGTYTIWGMIYDGKHLQRFDGAPGTVTILGKYGVGEFVDIDLSSYGTIYSVSGYPSGLSYNSKTKHLTGRPKAAGSKTVTVQVLAPDGKTKQSKTFTINVEPLPPWAVGTFTSFLQPPTPADTTAFGLGGYLRITTDSGGAYSGSLVLGAKSYPFKSSDEGNSVLAGGSGSVDRLALQVQVVLDKKRGENVTLNLLFKPGDAETSPGLTGLASDKSGALPLGPGWRHVWNSKTNPAFGNVKRTLNIACPWSLNDLGESGPGGTGYGTITVDGSGTADWALRLSDGKAVSSRFVASPEGVVPFYSHVSYTGGGAVFALLETVQVGELLKVKNAPVSNGCWIKRASSDTKDRQYRSGFDLDLDIFGAEHKAPAKNVLLFGNPAAPAAMTFELEEGGLESASQLPGADTVSLDAELRANNVIAVTETGLTVRVTPSFVAKTGMLSGSITLFDTAPLNGKKVERKLSFNGLYIPDLAAPGQSAVHGFFTLPELPDAVGETSSNTPVNSGRIDLGR